MNESITVCAHRRLFNIKVDIEIVNIHEGYKNRILNEPLVPNIQLPEYSSTSIISELTDKTIDNIYTSSSQKWKGK